jgi:hypothetical protein
VICEFEIGNEPLGMTSKPKGPIGRADTNVQTAEQKTARYVSCIAVVNNYDCELRYLVRNVMANMKRRAYMS